MNKYHDEFSSVKMDIKPKQEIAYSNCSQEKRDKSMTEYKAKSFKDMAEYNNCTVPNKRLLCNV